MLSRWLAVTVYHRGAASQTRLLAEGLAPPLRALAREGAVRSAWCARFDARGPHVFLLLGVEPDAAEAVSARLFAEVGAYLARHPSEEALSPEILRERHEACRGKALSPTDRLPGIAPVDTVVIVPQEPDGYPLPLAQGMAPAEADALWRAATLLLRWGAREGARGAGTRAALTLCAAVDRALRDAGADPEGAWRHHASTLLPALAERLEREAEAVHAAVRRAVTPRNRLAFDAAWAAGGAGAPRGAVARVVRLTLDGSGAPRWRVLREVVHCTLAVLGEPVSHHVPLVLYAWGRALPEPAAAGGA